MDTKESRTAWIIAGILAILLIIAVIFWMNAKKDLDTVLEEGRQDITTLRDQIEVDCRGTDEASKERCADDLDDLAEILKEFSEDIEDAPPAEGTTTPEPQ